MKCPSCSTSLHMTERKGIEIDYCPECRGVWLDRGELDKILEKSMEEIRQSQHARSQVHKSMAKQEHHSQDNYYKNSKHHGYKKYKQKKPWFMDLFD